METSELVAWAGLGLAVLLALILIWLWLRLRTLERRYKALMAGTGVEGGNGSPSLGELIAGQGRQLGNAVSEINTLTKAVQSMGITLKGSVQHVGLIRFNPFQETGGDQSFALAMLDGRGDGVVISSLHSRAMTRFYAKPIKGGASPVSLSDEEAQAVQQALDTNRRS
ncbi:MAG TPA: DUF4446 family protein [Chloroflexia bacterium]|nr:DUF4446 family protein [Chloroflexia bacterium]